MNNDRTKTLTGIGNAIVDVLIDVQEETLDGLGLIKGSMQLCSEDFQDIILAENTRYGISPGGSVANSISTLSGLKIQSRFFGTVGDDNFGQTFTQSLNQNGVELSLDVDEYLPTGKSVVLITPDGERTMSTNLGASSSSTTNQLLLASKMSSDYIFFEGYLIDSDDTWADIVEILPLLEANGTKIILTLSDAYCVKSNLTRFKMLADRSSIIFANSKEICALWGIDEGQIDYSDLPSTLNSTTLVITRSENGATISKNGMIQTVPAQQDLDILDLTGAGDQFAAGYIFGMLQGWDSYFCLKFGINLASKIIVKIGPRFRLEELHGIASEFIAQHQLSNIGSNVS